MLMFISLFCMANLQILMRLLLDSGFIWAESAQRVLVLWLTLWGASIATREVAHIRLDALIRYLSPVQQRWVARGVALFSSVVCGLIAWHSFSVVLAEAEEKTMAFAGVPVWLTALMMPLAFGIMSLRFLQHTFVAPPDSHTLDSRAALSESV